MWNAVKEEPKWLLESVVEEVPKAEAKAEEETEEDIASVRTG